MQNLSLVEGEMVVVSRFGESPEDAIESAMSLEPMRPVEVTALRPHDVLIRVRSAAVGWVDLLMSSGQYQHMPHPPYCPGLEYSGEVAWTGADVSRCRVGDRVLIDGFLAGPRSLGDYQPYGGFATFAVAPEEAVHAIPTGYSFDEACNLLGNYETAYHCLITRGRLSREKKETVLIHGAAGSTGLAAVQVAKLMGATVIATGRSEEKLAVVKAQGADHVVLIGGSAGAGATSWLRDQVKGLTEGRGVDVVYDPVGGELSIESLKCVAFGARFLVVGWASTPFVARGGGGRGAPNANLLPTNLIMMKGLDVLGCPTVISTINDPSIRPPRQKQILEWAESGAIRPYVSHTFPLAQFREALLLKWRGGVTGGCVLHP